MVGVLGNSMLGTVLQIILGLAIVGTALLLLNRTIRHSLAAPRVHESDVPKNVPWMEVAIATERGKKLFGWYMPAPGWAALPAPALAVIHGWGSNAEMMLPLAKPLHEAGYALLFFDARCHGRSDGDNFSSLPRFAEDLDHSVTWLRNRPGVDPARIGILGHSVGAGAALLVASRRADLAAVVSLAAFAHPAGMMRRWLKTKRIPYWPLGAYILFYVQRVIGFRFDSIAPCRTIQSVRCPVLLAHGTQDETVPVCEAEEIYANRQSAQVSLLLMTGSHDEYAELEQHISSVIGFLDGAMGRQGADEKR